MATFPPRRILAGLVGGVAAAAVVAAWFFAVDLAANAPLRTPDILARTLFGFDAGVSLGRAVLAYTTLHVAVLAALGVLVAWVLTLAHLRPSLGLGAVVGIGVLEGAYYVAVLASGANVLTVLPAGHVLGAKLAAGFAMMAVLHRGFRIEAEFGLAALKHYGLLMEGLALGLVGALAVAVWFLVLDVLRGAPFATPAALGSLFVLGATDPGGVQLTLGIVAAYTAVHVVAFAGVGVALAWSVRKVERRPSMWLLWLIAFVVLEALFLGVMLVAGEWVLQEVTWWAIGLGNVLALTAMGWRAWRTHPDLSRQLSREALETKV
jgi:hypothetical protein